MSYIKWENVVTFNLPIQKTLNFFKGISWPRLLNPNVLTYLHHQSGMTLQNTLQRLLISFACKSTAVHLIAISSFMETTFSQKLWKMLFDLLSPRNEFIVKRAAYFGVFFLQNPIDRNTHLHKVVEPRGSEVRQVWCSSGYWKAGFKTIDILLTCKSADLNATDWFTH